MTDAILVLNAGSSSLKFSLHAAPVADRSRSERPASDVLVRGQIERLGSAGAPLLTARTAQRAAAQRHEWPPGTVLVARGKRVLPARFHCARVARTPLGRGRPSRRARRRGLRYPCAGRCRCARAPAATRSAGAPASATQPCCDTNHCRDRADVAAGRVLRHGIPPRTGHAGATFGLPPEITGRGVRRYGFHGLSYEYVAQALHAIDSRAARGRVVVRSSWQRRQHVRDAQWNKRRDDDGLHTARRADDGHTRRVGSTPA